MLEAVILAGGKGSRLSSVVADRPKPLAEVGGRPFLEWLLRSLRAQGIQHVVLSVGYMADKIVQAFGDGSALGLSIVYSHEASPLGTAGALRHALSVTRGMRFLAMNGDSYCRLDLGSMLRQHLARNACASLCMTHVPDSGRYGALKLAHDGAIIGFEEKSPDRGPGWINAGVYLLERNVLDGLPEGEPASIERDVFPQLAGRGLYGFSVPAPFIDIGTPADYALAATVFAAEHQLLPPQPPLWPRERQTARAQAHVRETIEVLSRVADDGLPALLDACAMLTQAFTTGHKVLICGNGGSAADAQHLATEFVSRLTKDYPRSALPAIALTTDTSFLTAYTNDLGFDGVFARQVEALGKPSDVLLCLSTSGTSRNCALACDMAHARGMQIISITGQSGTLAGMADCAVQIPSTSTQPIQEATLVLYHILVDLTERMLFDS